MRHLRTSFRVFYYAATFTDTVAERRKLSLDTDAERFFTVWLIKEFAELSVLVCVSFPRLYATQERLSKEEHHRER